MSAVFELSPPGAKPMLMLLALGVLLPLCIFVLALLWSNKSVSAVMISIIFVAILLPASVIGWSAYSRRSLEIRGDEIVVKAAFYTTRLKRSELGPAVLIGLDELPGGGISARTNGIGLPGYQAGWFARRNGRSLFAFIAGGTLLYVPTQKDFDIVLSLPDPSAALEDLKKLP